MSACLGYPCSIGLHQPSCPLAPKEHSRKFAPIDEVSDLSGRIKALIEEWETPRIDTGPHGGKYFPVFNTKHAAARLRTVLDEG